MITADLTLPNMKATQDVVHRAVRSTTEALVTEIKSELRDEVATSLKITRPWLLQGFASEYGAIGPGAFTARIWHRDAYLRKHEEGATLEARNEHILIPSEELKKKRTFDTRRSWLKSSKTFKKGNTLFVRKGKGALRVGTLAKETNYGQKINLIERATQTVEQQARIFFQRYINEY